VVALRGGRSPLAMPLALPLVLLTLAVVCWSFGALAYRTTGLAAWHLLDISTAPFCIPLTLHFALAFTGRVRRWRTLVIVTYVVFGAYALLSGLSGYWPAVAPLGADVYPWSRVTIAAGVVAVISSFALLIVHLRSASDRDEWARTWLLLFALGVVTILGPTDYWLPPPAHLGALGALLGAGILALATLRFQLFEKDLPTSAAAETLVLVAVAVVSYLGAFQLLRRNHALLTLSLALVTLALFAALRYVFGAFSARRERVERLATLGTFSAQLAHDLKNPLAALKGAAQYLKEEWNQGRTSEHAEYCDLIAAQVDRLDRIVDRYQRLGHLEPVRERLGLNELVQNALALQRFAPGQPGQPLSVKAELSQDLPACQADRDLLSVVLDNLLRNAAEAMPEGGTLTVRTAKEREEILLSVEDTGVGMSPRTRERAFDGFFTTKAQGSGLGLAFVRRVAEAHGGGVSLTSEVGRGTVVRLHLPLE
jgi:two-component system, NtrC family, sensor histidine kinase HydH